MHSLIGSRALFRLSNKCRNISSEIGPRFDVIPFDDTQFLTTSLAQECDQLKRHYKTYKLRRAPAAVTTASQEMRV